MMTLTFTVDYYHFAMSQGAVTFLYTGDAKSDLCCFITMMTFTLSHKPCFLRQEIRSVEHGICPIAEFTSPSLNCAAILAIRP